MVASELEELRARVRHLELQRDACQAASNRDLALRREAESQVANLRMALAFARSVIKSGEPWTETCEEEIGSLLR